MNLHTNLQCLCMHQNAAMHDFSIVVGHRRRWAIDHQLKATKSVVETTDVLDHLYGDHKTSLN